MTQEPIPVSNVWGFWATTWPRLELVATARHSPASPPASHFLISNCGFIYFLFQGFEVRFGKGRPPVRAEGRFLPRSKPIEFHDNNGPLDERLALLLVMTRH